MSRTIIVGAIFGTLAYSTDNLWQFAGAFAGAFVALMANRKGTVEAINEAILQHEKRCIMHKKEGT